MKVWISEMRNVPGKNAVSYWLARASYDTKKGNGQQTICTELFIINQLYLDVHKKNRILILDYMRTMSFIAMLFIAYFS